VRVLIALRQPGHVDLVAADFTRQRREIFGRRHDLQGAADPATVTVAAAAAIVVTRNFVRERMIVSSF
jgi:hypothetical protein